MFRAVASAMWTSMSGQEQPSSSQVRSHRPWSHCLPWVRRRQRQREAAEAAQAKAQRRLNREHMREERQKRREELELRVHQLLDQVWELRLAHSRHRDVIDVVSKALLQHMKSRLQQLPPEQLREHDEKLTHELERFFVRNRWHRQAAGEDQVDSQAHTARN